MQSVKLLLLASFCVIVLIFISLLVLRRHTIFLQKGKRASGVFKHYKVVKNDKGSKEYYPSVVFEAFNGLRIYEASKYSEKESRVKDSEVVVMYSPSKPEEFIIEGQDPKKGVMGSILLILGIHIALTLYLLYQDPELFSKVAAFVDHLKK